MVPGAKPLIFLSVSFLFHKGDSLGPSLLVMELRLTYNGHTGWRSTGFYGLGIQFLQESNSNLRVIFKMGIQDHYVRGANKFKIPSGVQTQVKATNLC